MPDRLSEIEARLARVEDAVRLLTSRQLASPLPRLPGSAMPRDDAGVVGADVDGTALLTLLGRTCLVFGGAYALRAFTQSGRLPLAMGVGAGLTYALVWLGAAARTPSARRLSGLFHGLAAILIALPLVWEATVPLHVLSPRASATTLVALTSLGLLVAARRRLPGLAAVMIAGSFIAHGVFVVALGPMPFAASLLAVGGAALWVAEWCGWPWLRASAVVGAGCAFALAAPAHRSLVTALMLLAAGAAYGAAFGWFGRLNAAATARFYATLSLVLAILGIVTARMITRPVTVFAGVTIAAAIAGSQWARPWLVLHGVIYNVATTIAAGTAAVAIVVWTSPVWPALHGVDALAVATTLVCVVFRPPIPQRLRDGPVAITALVSRVLLAVTVIVMAAGLLVRLSTLWIADRSVHPGALAASRTLVLAAGAIALGVLGRSRRFTEFGWFVYPVLGLGAVKLAADDFAHAGPSALFVSLAAYGAALVIVARLGRSKRTEHGAPGRS